MTHPAFAYELDKESWAYKAMVMGGFDILDFELFHEGYYYSDPNWRYAVFDFKVHCVCGNTEWGRLTTDLPASEYAGNGKIDVARWIEDGGFFGEDHLKQDGYSPEQIMQIRKPMTEMRPL